MGEAGAQRRQQHARNDDACQRGQINEPQAVGGNSRLTDTSHQEAGSARRSERPADGRSGADGLVDRGAALDQIGDDQCRAAGGGQTGDHPDQARRQVQPRTRQGHGTRRGFLAKKHLRRDVINQQCKHDGQHTDIQRAGQQCAAEGADHDTRRHAPYDLPVHCAMAVVGTNAGNRSEQDGRH